jgi:hypothetical protein
MASWLRHQLHSNIAFFLLQLERPAKCSTPHLTTATKACQHSSAFAVMCPNTGIQQYLLDLSRHRSEPPRPSHVHVRGAMTAPACWGLPLYQQHALHSPHTPTQLRSLTDSEGACLLQGDAPAIWRGPIVNTTINKFLYGTAWGDLDVLVVDMPPGEAVARHAGWQPPCALLATARGYSHWWPLRLGWVPALPTTPCPAQPSSVVTQAVALWSCGRMLHLL